MKILHVTSKPFDSTHGGLEIYLRQICGQQCAKGAEVSFLGVISSNEPALRRLQKSGPEFLSVQVRELLLPQAWRSWAEVKYICELEEALLQMIQEISPDIVHCHHGFATNVISVCRRLNIPCVYTCHCSEIFCITGLLLRPDGTGCDGVLATEKCLKCCGGNLRFSLLWRILLRGLPVKFRLRAERLFPQLPFVYFLTPLFRQTYLLREMEKHLAVFRTADAVIAPSQAVADLIRRQERFSNVKIIQHGIPAVKHLDFPAPEDRIVKFYYVGRLCPEKGILIMLKAFSQLPPDRYQLHVIGCPGSRYEARFVDRLKAEFKHLPVFWHGKVPHEHLSDFVKNYHVMIHPAIGFEVYGLAVAEALGWGRPVLATRCGGPEMQVIPGRNGWLVERNSVEDMKNCLLEILRFPERLADMAHACSARFIDAHVRELDDLYRQILASKVIK